MKSHKRFSRASGSELAKLRKLQQRGWKPGRGYVGDWLRSSRKAKHQVETIEVMASSVTG